MIKEENDLAQIYKMTDFIHNNLSSSSHMWLKMKYKLVQAESLYSEIKHQEGVVDVDNSKLPQEKMKLLCDMLAPTFQNVLNYDELWNGTIFENEDKKNLLTSLSHQEVSGLTVTKMKFTKLFLEICQKSLDYDIVREIYKKKQQAFKLVEAMNDQKDSYKAIEMLEELRIVFEMSKKLYLTVLSEAIEDQLQRYK